MGSTGTGTTTPAVLKAEVWHEDTSGWSVGRTSGGDIYIGTERNPEFLKDTPENRERAINYWKANSFSREIKIKRR